MITGDWDPQTAMMTGDWEPQTAMITGDWEPQTAMMTGIWEVGGLSPGQDTRVEQVFHPTGKRARFTLKYANYYTFIETLSLQGSIKLQIICVSLYIYSHVNYCY